MGGRMYTVQAGDKEIPIHTLPILVAMYKAGKIQDHFQVYDHNEACWKTVEELVAPVLAEQQSTSQQQSPPQPGTTKTTPGLAVAAFVTSMAGFVLCLVFGIVGLVLGYQARRNIDANPDLYEGRGFATAAIVIGWIQIGLMILVGIGIFAAIAIPSLANL